VNLVVERQRAEDAQRAVQERGEGVEQPAVDLGQAGADLGSDDLVAARKGTEGTEIEAT